MPCGYVVEQCKLYNSVELSISQSTTDMIRRSVYSNKFVLS